MGDNFEWHKDEIQRPVVLTVDINWAVFCSESLKDKFSYFQKYIKKILNDNIVIQIQHD